MEKILILDFGSQYTQLIARRVRELNVYEIHPFNKIPELDADIKGVILSGSPSSVRDADAPKPDLSEIKGKLPLLGVCYGAQLLAAEFGGEVEGAPSREYGRAMLRVVDKLDPLMLNVPSPTQVWMSHGDTITRLPESYKVIGSTENVRAAAYHIEGEKPGAFSSTLRCIIPPTALRFSPISFMESADAPAHGAPTLSLRPQWRNSRLNLATTA